MQKKEAITIAKPYFEFYPSVSEFHITADKQAFENKTHAGNHAKSFAAKENQVVVSVTREDVVEASEVIVTPLIISVPEGAVISVDNPDAAKIISTEEAQQTAEDAKNSEASDTKPIEAADVKTTAESIDDKTDVVAEANTAKAKKPATVKK